MHRELRPVRVNADLDRFDAEFAEAGGLVLADEQRIDLELHAKHQTAGVFEKVEEILAEKNLAAAEREDEDAGIGHLVEQVLDLRGGHLAMVVVIEIAVHTALVAAVGQIELDAERDVQLQRLIRHLLQQSAHRDSPAPGLRGGIGSSEICRISWLANSRARDSASCNASAGSTSNSRQMRSSTISSSGVVPSADCHKMVAVLFKVKSVESRPDMIIISPSRLRAATRGLRAT
jgi:hypothetical protein